MNTTRPVPRTLLKNNVKDVQSVCSDLHQLMEIHSSSARLLGRTYSRLAAVCSVFILYSGRDDVYFTHFTLQAIILESEERDM